MTVMALTPALSCGAGDLSGGAASRRAAALPGLLGRRAAAARARFGPPAALTGVVSVTGG